MPREPSSMRSNTGGTSPNGNASKTRSGHRRRGTSTSRSRDGTYLGGLVSATPLMVDDTFLGSVGIVTDITRMKQVESELRTAKEFSEKIIKKITANLITVDPLTHHT